MTHDRRSFLKRSSAALSAAALSGCAPDGSSPPPDRRDGRLDPSLLRAVADLVLPEELGGSGREAAVAAFERWTLAYDPVPELNHGYGTSEIRYGPADPVPAWQAQLEALDLEAGRRRGTSFTGLDPEAQRALLIRHLDGSEGGTLPDPLRARHVAVALLAHWAGTPGATDLCYGARVSPQTCRGIEGSRSQPETLA